METSSLLRAAATASDGRTPAVGVWCRRLIELAWAHRPHQERRRAPTWCLAGSDRCV